MNKELQFPWQPIYWSQHFIIVKRLVFSEKWDLKWVTENLSVLVIAYCFNQVNHAVARPVGAPFMCQFYDWDGGKKLSALGPLVKATAAGFYYLIVVRWNFDVPNIYICISLIFSLPKALEPLQSYFHWTLFCFEDPESVILASWNCTQFFSQVHLIWT